MPWIDELAGRLGAEQLSENEVERLLEIARDVAHNVERKVTPLAAFILGVSVQERVQDGAARAAAIDAAIADVRATLPST